MRSVNSQYNEIAGYHLAERLGSGGMGDVFKAYHPGLNRTAAVKILYQKEMAERFKNEAYIQSAVNHPNITRLYEYVVNGDTPCIIMEYVEGESLDAYLYKKGRLSSEETESILVQISSALAYLHERDILHRDLKPQNFKIQPDGKVKMLDFGIAKHKYSPKLTQEGFVVGTTEYMSPEQFQQRVEKKSDIWSLGVMTYELITGHMPFEANNLLSLRSRISKASFTDPKILVASVSEKIATVIDKSLRVNPANRASATEIQKILTNTIKTREQKKDTVIHIPVNAKLLKPVLILAGAVLVFFLLSKMVQDDPVVGPVKPPADNQQADGPAKITRKIRINVPGIDHAVLVFPDGSRHTPPYEVAGADGENVRFRIQAEGYHDKEVQFDLKMGPFSYDFILEKINRE